MATHTPTTPRRRSGPNSNSGTRRDLFAAAGFTALASIATIAIAAPDGTISTVAVQNHQDAELIVFCRESARIEAQLLAVYDLLERSPAGAPGRAASVAQLDRLNEQQDLLTDRIRRMPTRTIDGLRARARLIIATDHGALEQSLDGRGLLWPLISALAAEQPA